ncbi:MAG: M3 family oligoendopeptidase [Chloroflexota bacterium]|nr:M3 family oligoendopeptidase [Chloroflexota bacterium]
MTVVYPGLDSPEFAAGFAAAVAGIADLEALFDAEGVGQRPPAPLDDATVAAVERVIDRFNALLEVNETLGAYLYAFVSTDSRDDAAQARLSELQREGVRLRHLGNRFTAWIGGLDVEALIARSPLAAAHAFPLRQATVAAAHLMSPAEEELAAELSLPGGTAWGKLHANLSSQIVVRLDVDGEERALAMSELRNLALHPDRDVRRRAYDAEIAAWEAAALPLAAALNGIKGQVNVLSARRGWADPLDEALFDAHIDRETLDALLTAAREAFPDLRRYLRLKARALGLPALAWFDLFAPIGEAGRSWQWEEATAFLLDQFGAYSERMRGLAERAFRERWIDAGPRPGKRGGAFCMGLRGEESRILANYAPSYDGVSTLAHELGHAYHNLNEAGLPPLQRQTPMTLAETASTFCETIVREAALADAGPAERLFILEQSLQGSCQIVVDIVSRFDFERRVFAARREREVSIDELNAFMLEAQRGTYGDGLDEGTLHPFMWAVKGHYYSAERSFYNFPYLFGLLFGLGLYARYQEDPVGFRAGYDDLLTNTGRADAAELAARFGVDVRVPAFWRASLDVVRADVARFEELSATTNS